MQTFNRICIKDFTVTADNGDSFTLKRGREYLTSAVGNAPSVVVFDTYWVHVPADIFAGEIEFTGV